MLTRAGSIASSIGECLANGMVARENTVAEKPRTLVPFARAHFIDEYLSCTKNGVQIHQYCTYQHDI